MPVHTWLIILYTISTPISDLTASSNNNLTVFGPSVAVVQFYASPMYITLDF